MTTKATVCKQKADVTHTNAGFSHVKTADVLCKREQLQTFALVSQERTPMTHLSLKTPNLQLQMVQEDNTCDVSRTTAEFLLRPYFSFCIFTNLVESTQSIGQPIMNGYILNTSAV